MIPRVFKHYATTPEGARQITVAKIIQMGGFVGGRFWRHPQEKFSFRLLDGHQQRPSQGARPSTEREQAMTRRHIKFVDYEFHEGRRARRHVIVRGDA